MPFVQNFPFISIILAMFTGVICVCLKPKSSKYISLLSFTLIGIMSVSLLLYTLSTNESFIYTMGHFAAPFGNEIRAGILEALMASVFTIVLILSLTAGEKHIFHDVENSKINIYYLMICLLYSSMLALIYTNDLFTAYVFVEINTIAACAIVMLKKSKKTLVATTKYLVMSLLGSGLLLLGICIIYDISGHLLMSNIKEAIALIFANKQYLVPLEITVGLFTIALAIKSAIFPFHTWLPDAHGNATSSSSAILSGLVLKAYIILLIKIIYRVIGIDIITSLHITDILFVMGLLAMIIGSLNALKEKDIKKMIAYSSVAQIGYIYVGIGLGSALGMAACCLHIIVHAITKPMLFTSAGALMEVSNNSKAFNDLKGAGRRNKVAGIAMLVGTLSMVGIPLFAGLASKFYLALAGSALSIKSIALLIALTISTMLNALYYLPTLMVIFAKEENNKVNVKKDYLFIVSTICFILLNIALGIYFQPVMTWIEQGLKMFS